MSVCGDGKMGSQGWTWGLGDPGVLSSATMVEGKVPGSEIQPLVQGSAVPVPLVPVPLGKGGPRWGDVKRRQDVGRLWPSRAARPPPAEVGVGRWVAVVGGDGGREVLQGVMHEGHEQGQQNNLDLLEAADSPDLQQEVSEGHGAGPIAAALELRSGLPHLLPVFRC